MAFAPCENHPTREAIGLCVVCRTRVCAECSTKIEGRNHCTRCLAGLAAEGGRVTGARVARSAVALHLTVALQLCLLALGLYGLLQILLPG